MRYILPLLALATPALAEDQRDLDAHEHGVGALNMAIEGSAVAMEFHAPGADIVGFEYLPETDADRAAVEAALSTLAKPLSLFAFSEAAGCSVTSVSVELEAEGAHDDHEEHAEDSHDDHDHQENAAAEVMHTEFHAEYAFTCAKPESLVDLTFLYFDAFENAREVEVQVVTDSGAQAFEVVHDAPVLNLKDMF